MPARFRITKADAVTYIEGVDSSVRCLVVVMITNLREAHFAGIFLDYNNICEYGEQLMPPAVPSSSLSPRLIREWLQPFCSLLAAGPHLGACLVHGSWLGLLRRVHGHPRVFSSRSRKFFPVFVLGCFVHRCKHC